MEYMVARATVRRSAGGGDGGAAASSAAAIPGLGGNTATVCARTRCCTAAGQKNAMKKPSATYGTMIYMYTCTCRADRRPRALHAGHC